MSKVYKNIINLLQKYQITYQEFDHDPILSYEDAEREAKKFGWKGIESKNVFMKGKNDQYYVFVTTQGVKVDFKAMKELLGTKCSLVSADEVKNVIHCVPGCVSPFGFSEEIKVILDPHLFNHDEYLFSPGVTTKTIQLNVKDLKIVFDDLENFVIRL